MYIPKPDSFVQVYCIVIAFRYYNDKKGYCITQTGTSSVAKRILYIFILTLLTGLLIFSIMMMVKYYKEATAENDNKTPTTKQEAVPGTPTPTPTQAPSFVTPTPTPIPTPSPIIDYTEEFYMTRITLEIMERIEGKSYPEGATIDVEDLRWLHVMHYGFDGEIHEGELIVNREVAHDVLEIFRELFAIKYPIEKIRLIDEYDAEDEASMEDNNSSAFCYRTIAESDTLSNHALGLAIDINPLYNPYVYTRKDGTTFLQPENAEEYVDRELENPYYIKKDDDCYRIFTEHGFTWGGEWKGKKDYQHFEKAIK